MPWEEKNVIEERMKFVAAWKSGGWSMTDLRREFGISRKTGYKYLERYDREGLDALKDRSGARKHQTHVIRDKLVDMVVKARKQHPTWGSRKLLASLMGRYPTIEDWPAPATIGRILSRKGLIKPDRRRRRKNIFATFPLSHVLDNGPPFAAHNGLAGLSRLSVWWLKIGIRLERIEPGKPQQNGRHERMHRTLKQETALPPRSSLRSQQTEFNRFKHEYNFERPHEALKNQFPAQIYKRSIREFPEALSEIAYPTNFEPHRVSAEGTIPFTMHRVFLSASLAGEVIGLEEISDRHMRIHFAAGALGVLDTFTGKVLQYRNPEPIIRV